MDNIRSFSIGVLLLGLVWLQTPASFAQTASTAAPSAKEKILSKLRKKHDKHPAIHAAMMKLRHAKREIEKATNENSAHKQKAIEAINTALEELHETIAHAPKS